ncbi:amino acid ABC transporter ATP-binding protein [uncultured Cohaesibacter sp.]|uniref:amino acid ABC transporter ATP-binding protein n=1 Tax=uncultured Cohaesibacter sp. TaxID=1002546 RepID=UPI0029C66E6A|nr:amino acid ABC transporter ATP-binding protein [uncultured Cohaesibacter sp.]
MTAALDNSNPIIRADKVNKFFGVFHALKDIDLTVARGETVVLCGPSGSGKSTLIRCLNALETHEKGDLEVAGVHLSGKRKDMDEVRRKTGMVFQSFNLFPHMTVIENCMIAQMRVKKSSKEDARKVAERFLARVKIPEQANKYPSQLSGGQQQRVAIARALCMNPEVMLFDEPTSALDPEMVREVLDTMVELAQEGSTMICVTHEMNFARKVANKVVFMDEGRILEVAEPDEFFTNPQHDRAKEFLAQILN